jgi:hypothetical protein
MLDDDNDEEKNVGLRLLQQQRKEEEKEVLPFIIFVMHTHMYTHCTRTHKLHHHHLCLYKHQKCFMFPLRSVFGCIMCGGYTLKNCCCRFMIL